MFANAAAEVLTRFARSELQGMDFLTIVHPDDQKSVRDRELARTGKTDIPDRFECRIVTKQREERWVDITSGWIRYEGIPVRLITALDITERKEAEMKMRLLASELSTTEERERRRMASYLHDVIGQTLALCKIRIRRLQKAVGQNPDSGALEEIRQMIDQSIHSTQSLTFELCPPILYELSFEAAVEWLTERLHRQYGINVSFTDDKQSKPIATELRVVLFQAVREACVNAIKHSEAKQIDVTVARVDGNIRVTVADNGIGFDPSPQNVTKAESGFGLFNIRERLKHLGSSMSIESSPQKGTSVVIEATLSNQQESQFSA
jgi:PAS domain S-box-containing protein